MDSPSSCGTLGTSLPLSLSVPICKVGRTKPHFPCGPPPPPPPNIRDQSGQSAWPLPGLTATPLWPRSSLCSAGHLDTQDKNTALTGSGGRQPRGHPARVWICFSHRPHIGRPCSPSNTDKETGVSRLAAAEPWAAHSPPALGGLRGTCR